VKAVLNCNSGVLATVTRLFEAPVNCKALPNGPDVQVAFDTVPTKPLPEASAALDPWPSLKP
jgi:hypothetical protein